MIGISSLMFFMATWHMVMNAWRLCLGYVDHSLTPGGPAAFIGNLRTWDHILKDTLYATQENLGSAAAVSYWIFLLAPCPQSDIGRSIDAGSYGVGTGG
jgi:hypothetical protein